MKVYLTNDGFDMRAYDVLESAKPDEAVFSIIRDFFSTNDDINAEECIEKMKEDEDTSSYTLKEMCSLFNEVSEVDYGFIYSIYPEDYAGYAGTAQIRAEPLCSEDHPLHHQSR